MKSYSQSSQDLFVLSMTDKKTNGFYLEVGGNDPIHINNTYVLESQFGWSGLSVEIDENQVTKYNAARNNKCTLANALTLDYNKFLEAANAPSQIDYLSLDIEPALKTLQCLQQLPHDSYRFSVITFEHESYYEGTHIRDASRKFLSDLGYQLVVGDVMNSGNPYEDWYVDPRVIGEPLWKRHEASGIEHSNVKF